MEMHNDPFQLQTHQLVPVLCPISSSGYSDELNYGRAISGSMCSYLQKLQRLDLSSSDPTRQA